MIPIVSKKQSISMNILLSLLNLSANLFFPIAAKKKTITSLPMRDNISPKHPESLFILS